MCVRKREEGCTFIDEGNYIKLRSNVCNKTHDRSIEFYPRFLDVRQRSETAATALDKAAPKKYIDGRQRPREVAADSLSLINSIVRLHLCSAQTTSAGAASAQLQSSYMQR